MKKNKTLIIGLCALITVFAFCTPAIASDWSTFLKDNSNSGITADEAPIILPDEDLSWETHVGYVNTAPLVIGDTIYVASTENVSAVNKITGDIIWQSTMHNMNVIGNPVYGNNKIFVPTSGTGKVFAFDAGNGDELGNISVEENYVVSPIKYENGMIYFGTAINYNGDDGKFYCYDENDYENAEWTYDPNDGSGYYFAGAALIGDHVVFGNSKEQLTSLNKINGAIVDELNVTALWGDYTPALMRSSMTYSEENGRLYFASKSGYCFAIGFNPATGNFNELDKARGEIGVTTSTPVIYNNRVYVGSGKVLDGDVGSGAVYCLDGTDLSQIWKFDPEEPVNFQSSPAISSRFESTDGSIYIYITSNTEKGSLYCLRDFAGNNQPICRFTYTPPTEMQEYILGSAVISDGRVYYANNEPNPGQGGYLFALANEESLDSDANTADMNPWNDLDSEGYPDGSFIAIREVIDAYNCFGNGDPAPETGDTIFIRDVIDMYNAFRYNNPM